MNAASTAGLVRKLETALASPVAAGLTDVPFLGSVCCVLGHRLWSVSLPGPAAIFVLQGRKTVFRGNDSFSVAAGRMFVLPGQMEVGIENEPDPKAGRYLALCLGLPRDMLARAVLSDEPPAAPAAASLADYLVAVDDALVLAVDHVLDMAAACPGNERLLALCLEAVVVLMAERTGVMPLLWSAAATWQARVAGLVGQDPARGWTAGELASRLAVGERSLRRGLSVEGTGVRRIIRDVRLTAALGLLQAGRLSVGEVAARCGYDSPSRFAVRFRERFGASPSDILRYNAFSGAQLADCEQRHPGR